MSHTTMLYIELRVPCCQQAKCEHLMSVCNYDVTLPTQLLLCIRLQVPCHQQAECEQLMSVCHGGVTHIPDKHCLLCIDVTCPRQQPMLNCKFPVISSQHLLSCVIVVWRVSNNSLLSTVSSSDQQAEWLSACHGGVTDAPHKCSTLNKTGHNREVPIPSAKQPKIPKHLAFLSREGRLVLKWHSFPNSLRAEQVPSGQTTVNKWAPTRCIIPVKDMVHTPL